MAFNLIDMNTWPRKPYFDHFMKDMKNQFSLSCNIDITPFLTWIKTNNYRFYASFICVVSKVINEMPEFRMQLDSKGRLGYYDDISPDYAIFNEKEKLFSCVYTKFQKDFKIFYQNIIDDMQKYKNVATVYANPMPKDSFSISCIPWLKFSCFSMHNYHYSANLMPLLLWGKFFKKESSYFLPLSISINHAAVDAYHVSKFFKRVEEICLKPEQELL